MKDPQGAPTGEISPLLALVEVSRVVNSTLDLDEVLRIVMDNIVRLTGAERGFLMLRDETGEFVTRIARNWERASIDPSETAISRTVVRRVVTEGKPVVTTNAQEDPRFGTQESIISFSLRSILCVPLQVKGELTGVLYADNRIRTGIFSEKDRDLLAAFANQAAVAIENARLFASVRRTLAEVTELKNLMDNVFASIASGVITTDLANQILLVNRAAGALLDCGDEELIGRSLDEILVRSGADQTMVQDVSAFVEKVRQKDQQVVGVEFRPAPPQRGPLTWSFNFSPLKNADQTTQGVAIVVDDLTEKKRLEAQRRLFERMVSPAVIHQIDPDQIELGGKRAAITTLFADVRGFTSFSEQRDPEKLVNILNCYLAAAADAVLAQDGTIDKFLGDAIMAWFNAPILQPDHALRAVRAALNMQRAISELRCKFPPEDQLSFGIGINYGDAILGLVGTDKHMEYTALGDSVNTAKRIQENAGAGQILITAAAYTLVAGQVRAVEVQPMQVKGKRQPVAVYEILGIK